MNAILLDILIVLVSAKVAAEGAERLGLPAVVGEIVAGLLIGPSVLGLVETSEVLRTLGEIGVILLLLQVGLEMDMGQLGDVGRASLSVAVIGVVLPFAGGLAVALAFGESTNTAIFVGAALTATSVGITARVFGDLRALASVEARTVLGAAVADDVLGLIILTVVVRLVSEGSVSVASVAGIAALALGFLIVTAAVGARLALALFGLIHRHSRSSGTLVAVALAFTLAFAELASLAKLATVVGAFVAGLSLAGSDQSERIRRDLTPVGHLFIPVFFLQIGIDADVASLVRPEVLAIAAGLMIVAVAGKMAAAVGLLGCPGDRLLVGLGMLPRGEVGLIFAGIGLREGILGNDLYAALLLVVLATTLVTPPLLGQRLRRLQQRQRTRAVGGPTPTGGWLTTAQGVVELRTDGGGRPPPAEALSIGLEAALAAATTRPGPELMEWLGSLDETPAVWDEGSRSAFFALLRHGSARSWRFLETTGLLERALPEVAAAVGRRRADPFELDPLHPVRFGLVDRVHELLSGPDSTSTDDADLTPEVVALAALLIEADVGLAAARQVVDRLDLGAAAEQDVALLVAESDLLLAAAVRADGLDAERVLQIATHLERPGRATALFVLSTAIDGLEPWQHQRLQALHHLVQQALGDPVAVSLPGDNLADRRRAEAVALAGPNTAAAARLAQAPRAWILSQEAAELTRLVALLEPAPDTADVRVEVVPAGRCRWRVELACRDRRGLLAGLALGLAESGLDVLEASAVTWADGGAVDVFTVTAVARPDSAMIAKHVRAALREPIHTAAIAGASVSFNDRASPWYTLCSVDAPDQPRLLYALATTFAACGANVHSAHITTDGARAIDHFQLTDDRGARLSEELKQAITVTMARGVSTLAPRRRGERWKSKLLRDGNNRVTSRKQASSTVDRNVHP